LYLKASKIKGKKVAYSFIQYINSFSW